MSTIKVCEFNLASWSWLPNNTIIIGDDEEFKRLVKLISDIQRDNAVKNTLRYYGREEE